MGRRLNTGGKMVYEALTKELDGRGISHSLDVNHDHPRIRFVWNGENQMVIFSASPKHTGTAKSVSFLRRVLSGQHQKIHKKN